MIVGSGRFKCRVSADWEKLPACLFNGVGGVGVDQHDNVFVFNRGEHPMIVFDRQGNFLRSWGEGSMSSCIKQDKHTGGAHGPTLCGPDRGSWAA
jgi:hypothetical protein